MSLPQIILNCLNVIEAAAGQHSPLNAFRQAAVNPTVMGSVSRACHRLSEIKGRAWSRPLHEAREGSREALTQVLLLPR